MENKLIIKGRIIGEGKPLVCVPVMGLDKETVISQIKDLVSKSAPMIEWRVDAFAEADNYNAIEEVLEEIKSLVEGTILVYTYRSAKQGGLGKYSDDVVKEIHKIGAESESVDFVDIEYFVSGKEEVERIRNYGANVIASHHNFDMTPKTDEMMSMLEEIKESGADVVKLAVMPNTADDVIRLLDVTEKFHKNNMERPLITMSMGALGAVSRIAGQLCGSCVTFGSGEQASAPGQLPFEKLEEILEVISL